MSARPLLLTLFLAGMPLPATAEPMTEYRLRELRAGTVVHEFIQQEEAGGAVRAMFMFHERPAAIWEVLRAFERTFEFVPGMRLSEEIERSETRARVRQSVKQHWLLPRLDYVAEFQYTPFTTIEYEQVEGDLRLLEGRWQFDWRPEEQITLVTHEMRVRAKFPVPRWLLRRSLARDVTDLLHCLRAKAGGSGSTEQERYDLGYCPDL